MLVMNQKEKQMNQPSTILHLKIYNLIKDKGFVFDLKQSLTTAGITCYTDDDTSFVGYVFILLDNAALKAEGEVLIKNCLRQQSRVIVADAGEKPLSLDSIKSLFEMGVEEVISNQSVPFVASYCVNKLKRWAIVETILEGPLVQKRLIGRSANWLSLLRKVIEISCFSTTSVLIQGESGTGKELIARLIHDLDKRVDKQHYVVLDCSTVVQELSGSEFFGHEKGAFTNAISNRDGAFASANKGTLFLDEIGELPARLQAELLRVTQEGNYKRVGSDFWKQTCFRLICATNKNLAVEVKKGNFREDLYFRLRACEVHLPPLRERKSDIPLLATHFLSEVSPVNTSLKFDHHAMNYLMTKDYTGNVRELRQLVHELSYSYSGGGVITLNNLRKSMWEDEESLPRENNLKEFIRRAICNGVGLKEIKKLVANLAMELAIENTEGNLQKAAIWLGVSDRMVQMYWAERQKYIHNSTSD